MNVTVDKFGRILIPKPVRERLGLTAGTELKLETGDHEILLRAINNEAPLIARGELLVCTAELSGGADDFGTVEYIKALRRDRIRGLSGLV